MITTENPKHIQLHEAGACLQGYKERTCPIGTITVATETAAGQGESTVRVCSKTTNKKTDHGKNESNILPRMHRGKPKHNRDTQAKEKESANG